MREAVTEAVLRSLDEKSRSAMIEAAIAYLLAPATEGYRQGTSPLQSLFNRTIEEVAREEIVKIMVAEDGVLRTHIRALHEEACKRIFDDERARAKIVEDVAHGIRRAITGERF